MHEIGIESSLLKEILAGRKTVEVRLGKPKILKLRVGDSISLREDVYLGGSIVESFADSAQVVVTQLLYFESFDELLSTVDFTAAIPGATSKADALTTYRQFYSTDDEAEYGAVAITFALT